MIAKSRDLFDYAESRAARDVGLSQVTDNNDEWITQALARVARIHEGWRGTGEDIRIIVGIQPAHHNAWGALINTAQRRGLITKTGRMSQMRAVRSHARLTPEYLRTANQGER